MSARNCQEPSYPLYHLYYGVEKEENLCYNKKSAAKKRTYKSLDFVYTVSSGE